MVDHNKAGPRGDVWVGRGRAVQSPRQQQVREDTPRCFAACGGVLLLSLELPGLSPLRPVLVLLLVVHAALAHTVLSRHALHHPLLLLHLLAISWSHLLRGGWWQVASEQPEHAHNQSDGCGATWRNMGIAHLGRLWAVVMLSDCSYRTAIHTCRCD